MRRKRSEIITRRSKTVRPLEKRISRIENDIESCEVELENLNNDMQQASQDQDGTRISELSQSIHACQSKIDKLFDELETATDELDSQNAVFERELRAAGGQLSQKAEVGSRKCGRRERIEGGKCEIAVGIEHAQSESMRGGKVQVKLRTDAASQMTTW